MHVDDPEVDQTAADLLDVSDPLRELEAVFEGVRPLVQASELSVRVPDDPHGRCQATLVSVLLEDLARLEAVGQRVFEAPLHRLRPRKLQEEQSDYGRPPRGRGLETG